MDLPNTRGIQQHSAKGLVIEMARHVPWHMALRLLFDELTEISAAARNRRSLPSPYTYVDNT